MALVLQTWASARCGAVAHQSLALRTEGVAKRSSTELSRLEGTLNNA